MTRRIELPSRAKLAKRSCSSPINSAQASSNQGARFKLLVERIKGGAERGDLRRPNVRVIDFCQGVIRGEFLAHVPEFLQIRCSRVLGVFPTKAGESTLTLKVRIFVGLFDRLWQLKKIRGQSVSAINKITVYAMTLQSEKTDIDQSRPNLSNKPFPLTAAGNKILHVDDWDALCWHNFLLVAPHSYRGSELKAKKILSRLLEKGPGAAPRHRQ